MNRIWFRIGVAFVGLTLVPCALLADPTEAPAAPPATSPSDASDDPGATPGPPRGIDIQPTVGHNEPNYPTGDWFGLRPKLIDAGITPGGKFIADYSKVFSGGAAPGGTAFRDLFNFNLTADADKIAGIKGGTFFFNFQNESGDNGSHDVGDVMGFDSIDADGRTQLAEIWYEQLLFDGKLSFKLGKIDPNATLAVSNYAGEYIHSSGGISPNIITPKYPDPAFGLLLRYVPAENVYVAGGVFDGSFQAEGIRTGSYGPAHLFGPPADLSLIGEFGFPLGGPSGFTIDRIALGFFHHTGTFTRLDGAGTEDGSTGFYMVSDITIWKPEAKDDPRGLFAYAEYAYADPRTQLLQHFASAGVTWVGPIPGRDTDAVGIGVNYGFFSPEAGLSGGGELAVEGFYKLQIAPFVSLKPDLQYIRNPGGARGRDDAFVGTVRLQVDL